MQAPSRERRETTQTTCVSHRALHMDDVLDADRDALEDLGVSIRVNQRCGLHRFIEKLLSNRAGLDKSDRSRPARECRHDSLGRNIAISHGG